MSERPVEKVWWERPRRTRATESPLKIDTQAVAAAQIARPGSARAPIEGECDVPLFFEKIRIRNRETTKKV